MFVLNFHNLQRKLTMMEHAHVRQLSKTKKYRSYNLSNNQLSLSKMHFKYQR